MSSVRNPVVNRRTFLKTGAVLSGVALADAGQGSPPEQHRDPFIDTNVTLFRWPLRRLPLEATGRLVDKLRSQGITQAWAGSFDVLGKEDLTAVNDRLSEECAHNGEGILFPFGSVNPVAAGWADEMKRCVRVHHMRGIRLYPNYHGYALDDPVFERLLCHAASLNLVVHLVVMIEDDLPVHRLPGGDPVDVSPLAAVIRKVSGLKLVLLNALGRVRGPVLDDLVDAGDVSVDTAMLEGVGGLETLLTRVPGERILFGSHAPFFYFEAAALKLKEALLTEDQSTAIRYANAARLLG